MSFEAQEQALFDLLFSPALRKRFEAEGPAALTGHGLAPDEIEEFRRLRPAALAMDAQMRTSMVLSQLCVAFPITFALASARGELDLLEELIDPDLMREAPTERTGAFGTRLRRALAADAEALPHGQATVAVLDVELGMEITGAALRAAAPAASPASTAPPPADWAQCPIEIADYVSASMLPCSYAVMKQTLCPVGDRALHRHLASTPVDPARVDALLAQPDPRVFVARPWLDHASICDPVTRHDTIELGEGFAIMLQHVDGRNSVDTLLTHLADAGAEAPLVDSVRSGFRRLVEADMLSVVTATS